MIFERHTDLWWMTTLQNNTIRCKTLATIISVRLNLKGPFFRQKQVSTSIVKWQQRTHCLMTDVPYVTGYIRCDYIRWLILCCYFAAHVLTCFRRSCYIFSMQNNCCEFLASHSVLFCFFFLSDDQLYFKKLVCGTFLLRHIVSIYKQYSFLLYASPLCFFL